MPLWQQERITLLLMAAFLGNVTVLKKLLQNPKMDTTIQQSMSGRTALHLACLGTSLDRTPRDIKNRLAAIDLLIEKPGLDFKDRNHRTPIFTLIDNGSPNYLKHLLQKIKPSVTNFQRHKKNRIDPFFYALKKNKKDHASVIIDYMDSIGKLSKYAEHIKEFVRKALIFNNGRYDLKLIAACNEVLEKKGIPGTVVKMPNLFKPLVSIPNDQNMICRGDSQSNLPVQNT
ncbi:ankyrin repeat domain-containing protein [Legionella sp. 227]|uniref:ankyrin repeat domain-containing protein n=1 Tax=Legionella sp. 227 TaxID=3367288 RepID=UPI00370D31C4